MDDVATNGNENDDVKQAEADVGCFDSATSTASTDEWCELCNVNCKTKSELAIHEGGSKHQKKLYSIDLIQKLMPEQDCIEQVPVSGLLRCLVCSTEMSAPQQMEAHLAGKKHKKKKRMADLIALGIEVPVKKEVKPEPVEYWCEICKISGGSPNMWGIEKHMLGAKHLKRVARNERLNKLKENTNVLEYDEEKGIFKCKVCNILSSNPKFLEDHFEGSKHKLKVEGRPAKRKHEDDPNYVEITICQEDAERTIFFKNITYTSAETEIRELFMDCGEIENLNIMKVIGKKDKGFGFLMFKHKESVPYALKKNQSCLVGFEGKPIHVAAYVPEKIYKLKRSEELEKNKLFVSGHPSTMSEEENQMEHTGFKDHGC